MPGMTCKCCREWLDVVTFTEATANKCSDCLIEHDRRHPAGWRDAIQQA